MKKKQHEEFKQLKQKRQELEVKQQEEQNQRKQERLELEEIASDAPTASVSVIYNADGVEEAFVMTRLNPVMVLVDTGVIARAPVRTLVAGMGDALATYFETDVAYLVQVGNI